MSGYKHLFGPVPSRRLGRSLGVDLNPMKVCSEDCVFCQVGRTTEKTLERREWVPMEAVRGEWERWLAEGGEADYVTLSGSGEPTLHSRFGEVIGWAHKAGFRAAILSNGSMMGDAAVRREAAGADVVKVTVSAWDEKSFARLHRPAAGLTFDDVAIMIPHQANLRIVEAVAQKLGGNLMERVFLNLDKYGNTSAASIPLALSEAWRQGKIKKGDRVLMVAFGGGLSWGGVILEWTK